MQALKIDDNIALVFTTVLDEMVRGLVDEDEEEQPIADRNYWEQRGTKATVTMADELLVLAKEFDPSLDLKYNKFYIGIIKDGQPNNFVTFRPKKNSLNLHVKLKQADDMAQTGPFASRRSFADKDTKLVGIMPVRLGCKVRTTPDNTSKGDQKLNH